MGLSLIGSQAFNGAYGAGTVSQALTVPAGANALAVLMSSVSNNVGAPSSVTWKGLTVPSKYNLAYANNAAYGFYLQGGQVVGNSNLVINYSYALDVIVAIWFANAGQVKQVINNTFSWSTQKSVHGAEALESYPSTAGNILVGTMCQVNGIAATPNSLTSLGSNSNGGEVIGTMNGNPAQKIDFTYPSSGDNGAALCPFMEIELLEGNVLARSRKGPF